MIELKNISKTFRKKSGSVHALSGVSLQVAAGEIFGVIGASGAGKSTLIRCINLLEKPTDGEVIVDGRPLLTLTARRLAQERRHIGMIFQHFNLLSSRTVHENVAFPLELSGTPRQIIDARVNELLALVGLTEKSAEYPSSLSGGQKQRVAIARTLASNPKVLLCDEATSALDPETTRSILDLLKDINRRFGITILLIAHEMNVIKAICDRVAIMSEGRIIEQGTVGAIFSHPREELTRRFIASSLHFAIPPEYAARLTQQAPTHAESPTGESPTGEHPTREQPRHPLVRLEFTAESAGLPLLSTISRQLAVDIHIVSAQLDQAGGANFGFMLVEITGTTENTQKAVDYYIAHHVKARVLGYV
jgi:D-methionine transport system ATP-binding protein